MTAAPTSTASGTGAPPVIYAGHATHINREHRAARDASASVVEHACRAGELLLEVKDALPHGEWGTWLKAHVDFSPRTARAYMLLARRRLELPASKWQRVADLPLRKALDEAFMHERHERARAARMATPLPCGAELRVGDFRVALDDLKPGSVDLILTDPPYGRAAVPLYRDLGKLGARVLKPGGSLVAYAGQATLPEVLAAVADSGLTYHWLLALNQISTTTKLLGFGVISRWKPAPWFTKGRRHDRTMVQDRIDGTRPDKDAHAWAQGSDEILPLVRALTQPGDLVVDPFCGTGSWGRAIAAAGRRWIGCDIADGGSEEIV